MLTTGLPRGLGLFLVMSLGGTAWLDFATGKELVVWALFLLPVVVASWMAGFRVGVAVSLFAAALMLAVGMLAGNSFPNAEYFVIAVANRTLALFVVAWLASRLYRKQALEAALKSYEETLDYYHLSPLPECGKCLSEGAAQGAASWAKRFE